jgi:hypothetical protein
MSFLSIVLFIGIIFKKKIICSALLKNELGKRSLIKREIPFLSNMNRCGTPILIF